jgi:hypothetical protein
MREQCRYKGEFCLLDGHLCIEDNHLECKLKELDGIDLCAIALWRLADTMKEFAQDHENR